MRKASLATALLLALLATSTTAAVRAQNQQATVVPSQPGHIFIVIDYKRAQGRAQATVVSASSSSALRSRTFAPYRSCRESTPAGVVLKLRNPQASTEPITFSTNGNIVRPPYIGQMPPEALHACYTQVTF